MASASYSSVPGPSTDPHSGRESCETTSTTSLILERINGPSDHDLDGDTAADSDLERGGHPKHEPYEDEDEDGDEDHEVHNEKPTGKRRRQWTEGERKVRRAAYMLGFLMIGGWCIALVIYLFTEQGRTPDTEHAVPGKFTGDRITLPEVMSGMFGVARKSVKWIGGATGQEDGLLLTVGGHKDGWLVVEDIKDSSKPVVLMSSREVEYEGDNIFAGRAWPSQDLKKVLIASGIESVWRHSFTAEYWVYDVATKKLEPLDPNSPNQRCSLASWSPKGNRIAYVHKNNIYIRDLSSSEVQKVTRDGGADVFNGIPDWVYEEEVFSSNSALWWDNEGKYFSFLTTNETEVPEFPIHYYLSRPSGESAEPGLEAYPDEQLIKYPKAGAPNPVVQLKFYDVEKNEMFTVPIDNDFSDKERLITEVTWANDGKVLVRETNRESDVLKMVLVNVKERNGRVIRELDVQALDGGWFEVSQDTHYIPADPENGRMEDGYIDTVIHDGYNHLAYFTPLDNPDPKMLTKGPWEVVEAPSAVDLKNNLVYFKSTQRSPIERHVYSVKLDGTDLKPFTDTSKDGRYDVSFSKLAGYAFLTYNGPDIPWQAIQGTPSGDPKFYRKIEDNKRLAEIVKKKALPTYHYSNVTIDGFTLQVVERRPPGFNPNKKYPVLFYLYGGPGSQQVSKAFRVDFQAFVASGLDYIVVTVDGRGTGFIGRKARVIIRGNLGYYEARDQIETAKIWAKKPYVDASNLAIWGWSYGGFMTLKTLEQDAGQTFSYGMAVAPVTDWRFYDSIYTERYMHTPQRNPQGYQNSSISNMTALASAKRFLVMHGSADDNVHFQNTLTLLDKFNLAGVENYDMHVFPDSDHSIYFHNANRIIYNKLATWLLTAFSGEFIQRDKLREKLKDRIGAAPTSWEGVEKRSLRDEVEVF